MAFEYGSIDLGIRNPFKFEGAIRTVRGTLTSLIGLYCLLSVQNLVESGNKLEGWLALGIGILLLANGLAVLGRGISQIVRFFVGRGVPTSLAKNIAISEIHTTETGIAYSAQEIEQMLQGRKNLTFSEPEGWFVRLVYTILPNLLFLPYPYRNLIQHVSRGLVQTFMGFLCYILAWFSGTTGLTTIKGTPILDWLAILLTAYLLIIWWSKCGPVIRALQVNKEVIGTTTILFWVTVAIMLPFGLGYFHHNIAALPSVPFSAVGYIMLITSLSIAVTGIMGVLTYLRAQQVEPIAEVSELREHWQESIHPQEVFINFENVVMANRRYRETPNRVYREFDASLIEEGSVDKGRFNGQIIQETQPVLRPTPIEPMLNLLRIGATIAGHLLLLLAVFWLYGAINDLAAIGGVNNDGQILMQSLNAAGLLLTTVILWLFGTALANYAHTFWAEMQFESLLVYFSCPGTYTESKLSTGTSIYDSTRSENTVIRSSMTPWVITSRIVSSCFSASGVRNLEYPRHIMELHSNDESLKTIIEEIKEFMNQRENIAGIDSSKDLDTTSNIYQVNKQTRIGIEGASTGSTEDESRKKIQLDDERGVEYKQSNGDIADDQ